MRDRPIYHITHVGNLPSILNSGRLWCDAQCRQRGCTANDVGYSHIKDRRMRRQVSVHPGTTLGQFVPFNFCSRSVMLYVLHKGHDGYRGGQNEILHLVSTVGRAIDCGRRWAFTDRHADLGYAEYFNQLDKEGEVDWLVMPLQYWSNDNDWFPWGAIAEIGVIDAAMQARVEECLADSDHRPTVRVKPGWYY
jgi:hypothetical protein